MSITTDLNARAERLASQCETEAEWMRIGIHRMGESRVLDFGVEVHGGLEAGLALARLCLGDAATVAVETPRPELGPWPTIAVSTDRPLVACMGGQYAGWPVQLGSFFAMGSGPMRMKRGREALLESLGLVDGSACAVGVLECDRLPDADVCLMVADACEVDPSRLTLAVAPTRSIAGSIQVVARSIETCLHKLHELKMDLNQVVSAWGSAPLPPPALDFAAGIGRTNDAILYGGQVTLWVDSEDAVIERIGPSVPSQTSRDWGKPFGEVFAAYEFDFYRVDPNLFSPAEVTVVNLRSGRSWRFGEARADVLRSSFATVN